MLGGDYPDNLHRNDSAAAYKQSSVFRRVGGK